MSHEEISSVVTKEPTDYILLVGAKIPVALSGRSESPTHAFLSLAASLATYSK